MADMTSTRTRLRPGHAVGRAVAVAMLMAGTSVFGVSTALADDGPSVPPGTEATSVPPSRSTPTTPT